MSNYASKDDREIEIFVRLSKNGVIAQNTLSV